MSTEKAYSSFPRLKNSELILFINTLLVHSLNPRPSLYNISAKNHLNYLQNLLFESLFVSVFVAIFVCSNIFDQRLLFDQKQIFFRPSSGWGTGWGGGGRGGTDEVWDRETMFSQLAKRSPCVVVSG